MRAKAGAFLAAVVATLAVSPALAAVPSFSKPEVIRYGATAADMERALVGLCTKRVTRVIEPPFLADVKRRQLQIDCDGFPFMGKGRWAEFVIRDDRLEMVWIMVDAAEQAAILKAMHNAMGPFATKSERYIAWPRQGAAWRFKPAEVLFFGPGVAKQAEGWFRE